jgi:hypothetical protein
MVDSLVVSAIHFRVPLPPKLKYDVGMKYRPSVPNNIEHWKVFEDDNEIKKFLEFVDEFFALHIDQDHDSESIPHDDVFLNKIANHHIVQLPSNHILKGLVPLEGLFDGNDVEVNFIGSADDVEIAEYNIGTEKDPKFVKLSSSLSREKRDEYAKVLNEFSDVFSWTFEYLRTYDTSIIEKTIPFKEESKPFRQKLRQINPMLLPIMEKQVKKILDAWIIIPLRYFEWVASLLPVINKNGEIRLCVDFQNLNKISKKDNYTLPNMEHILQRVTGASMMSMIDGFSSYNQVYVLPEDREKTSFTTPWGPFMYTNMPFRLMNAGAIFQRAMDIDFIGENDKFVVIYLYDIAMFSQSDKEHYDHLKRVFLKCIKFGLSLNPKKSLFSMKEGKLVGHICVS